MSKANKKLELTIDRLLDAIAESIVNRSPERAKLYAEAVGALAPLSFGRLPLGLESGAAITQGSESE